MIGDVPFTLFARAFVTFLHLIPDQITIATVTRRLPLEHCRIANHLVNSKLTYFAGIVNDGDVEVMYDQLIANLELHSIDCAVVTLGITNDEGRCILRIADNDILAKFTNLLDRFVNGFRWRLLFTFTINGLFTAFNWFFWLGDLLLDEIDF